MCQGGKASVTGQSHSAEMIRNWQGLSYCLLWYGSIAAGFLFIACPIIPIMFLSPPIFRRCGDLLFSIWELYPTVLLELFGVKIVVSGDHINPEDSAVLIMNHRTRVDWNFWWGGMYQACMPTVAAHNLKLILKDPIRHLPGPGWIMQMNRFLYITRCWDEDRGRLARSLDYLVSSRKRTQILLFPEGTDLTPSSKERSDRYALQNHLNQHLYTLHPKTTGFSYMVRHLQESEFLDAVYDITIAYPDKVPQTEVQMVLNGLPKEVHFHVQRIPAEKLPSNDVGLRKWLENRWETKENSLKTFYTQKRFPNEPWSTPKRLPLQIAFVFWTFLSGATVVLLIASPWFQGWALINSVVFLCLSGFTSGFNELEIKWDRKWKSSRGEFSQR